VHRFDHVEEHNRRVGDEIVFCRSAEFANGPHHRFGVLGTAKPDVRASHPALWIDLSQWQQQLP
jgi:hypothetical protein